MKYRITLIAIPLFFILAACAETLDYQVQQLVVNKNKWLETTNSKDYSFQLTINCFCSYSEKPIKVVVSNREVKEAEYVSSELDNKPINIKNIPTIKKLFISIFDAIKDEGMVVKAKYNQELGYPSLVQISMSPSVMDGTVTYSVEKMEIE